MIKLDAAVIEGFTEQFLLDSYDQPAPIAACHREWWAMVCDPHKKVAFAAPRSHAKSTAITHAFGLAAALFEVHPFQIKISKTYELACEKVKQAKEELITNEKIKHIFRLKKIIVDRENDFIAEMATGYRFRMRALGAGQATRGLSWGTMRPHLILGDDMEDDEEVLSEERREKMMRWLFNTILPMGGDHTLFRIYGTILHNDSLLWRLCNVKSWKSKIWEACDEIISPESILWPQKFTAERLQEIKTGYAEIGNLAGWNMEYRNIAIDTTSGYFRPEEFVAMEDGDENKSLTYYASVDFAISTKERRDYTVILVAGMDSEGFLYVVDCFRGRWDGKQIVDEMLSVERAYRPDEWYVEAGAIQKALGPSMELAMREDGEQGTFMNLKPMIPTKDKSSRARSIQARMRAKSVKFDKRSSWFHDFEQECLQFPRGTHDDQVDALAWIGLGLGRMVTPITEEEEDEFEYRRAREQVVPDGRSPFTGY